MKKFIFILPLLCLLCCSSPVYARAESGEIEDTWISEEIQQACIDYGNQYNICPELIMAIIETESSGRVDAVNGDCSGLMQISLKWHRDRMERLGVSDIFDLRGNILVGCDYLSELFEEYGDVGTVLMVYHGERNATSKTELSSYATTILDRSADLESLHEKETRGEEDNEEGIHLQSIPSDYRLRVRSKHQLCESAYIKSIKRWFCTYYSAFIFNPMLR